MIEINRLVNFISQNGHYVLLDNKYKFSIACFDFQNKKVRYISREKEKKTISFDKCSVMILTDFHKMTAETEFMPAGDDNV